jgi:hypothetical protein
MAIFYDDRAPKEPFTGKPVPYEKQDAMRHWSRHVDNLLVLEAIVKSPRDRNERALAENEITICRRKMTHWQKHVNYDTRAATAIMAAKRAQWSRAR